MKEELVNEFQLKNFTLEYNDGRLSVRETLKQFYCSIWPFISRLVYILYRFAIAIYYTVWLIESIIRNAEFREKNFQITNRNKTRSFIIHPWPFYMTSWSLTLLFFHLWCTALIAFYFFKIDDSSCLKFIVGGSSSSQQSSNTPSPTHGSLNKSGATAECCNNEMGSYKCLKNRVNNSSSPQATPTTTHLNQMSNNWHNNNRTKNGDDSPSLATLRQNPTEESLLSTYEVNTEPQIVNVVDRNETKEQHQHQNQQQQQQQQQVEDQAEPPCYMRILIKFSWLLYNITAISALVVTVSYFSYVYIAELEVEPNILTQIGNLHRHGFNSLVMLIDVFILAYPVRLLHALYTVTYGSLYATVAFFYWLTNPQKHIIYVTLDYNKPWATLAFFIFLSILTCILQVGHYFIYKLKLFIKQKCYNSDI